MIIEHPPFYDPKYVLLSPTKLHCVWVVFNIWEMGLLDLFLCKSQSYPYAAFVTIPLSYPPMMSP